MITKCIVSFVASLLALLFSVADGFNLGVRDIKCSLSQKDFNDPCPSLKSAICDGAHCKCPPGSYEDKSLTICKKGKGGRDDLSDLPFDYVPNGKNKPSKNATSPSSNRGSAFSPTTNRNGQPVFPALPPNNPVGYPRQPSTNPIQPASGYPQPKQPSDPRLGEKTGGGVGGVIGLLIIIGLVYFCCCRGEKGKKFMSKLPFGRGGGAGGQMHMQATPGQQTSMPSDQQYPAAPPPGQPPPYTATYQPSAPNAY